MMKKTLFIAVTLFQLSSVCQAKDILAPDVLSENKDTAFWARPLYGKVDRETQTGQIGFHSETKGITVGIDGAVSETFRLGGAYTNAETSVHWSDDVSADVNNNTVFGYFRYQPNDFFIDVAAAYGWGNVTKKQTGFKDDGYNTKLTLAQALSGVRYENAAPLWGFRYVNVKEDGIKKTSSDVLTGIIKMQAAKTYGLTENLTLRPDFSLAFTYDFVADENSVVVLLANGAGYTVDGKRMERLGAEIAGGITFGISNTLNLSALYAGAFKSDIQNHSFMFRLRFDF